MRMECKPYPLLSPSNCTGATETVEIMKIKQRQTIYCKLNHISYWQVSNSKITHLTYNISTTSEGCDNNFLRYVIYP
jgi:hypothetical protein